jgi:hypothetical protein
MTELGPDHPLLRLFHQLRRRDFKLGPDDLMSLHAVLAAGFGWKSRSALRDVCRALWAKSLEEQSVLDSLFDQLVTEDWVLQTAPAPSVSASADESPAIGPSAGERPPQAGGQPEPVGAPEVTTREKRLPPVHIDESRLSPRPFVMVPQYPLGFRDTAQAWRRLRRPMRSGPPTELDVNATVMARVRTGVATAPVLIPRRRNTARVLLLVDRDGSMSPFHDFVDVVCRAILQTARLGEAAVFYFHDLPNEGGNDVALAALPRDSLSPQVDSVLDRIVAAGVGWLYRDTELTDPVRLEEALSTHARSRAVVVLSDAGAAHGRYDVARVIDSLGLVEALRALCSTCVWLNPLPRERWSRSSAAELARHVPMFPLDREGTHRAVSFLRGHPLVLESPA